MSKKTLRLLPLLAAILLLGALSVHAQDKVVITWFVGLGTGTQAPQIPVQEKVVADFNASQDKIDLQINIAGSNQTAPDILSTLIAGGTPPDIVGPVGMDGSNQFKEQWMDLKPLVEAANYDLSAFPDALVGLYQDGDALLGIPFLVFPSLTFYNKDLFDEAGLEYPPTEFGAKYSLDGKDVDWDWNTVAELAKRLTVDANGNDANSPDFDPTNIVQYGFNNQWGTTRADFSAFGGSPVVVDGKVTISETWREAAQWMWDGVWKYHFSPTATVDASDLLKPSAFSSGKVAMSRVPLWYTCCMSELKSNWDIGVVPSYKGNYSAPTDADTFRLVKSSAHPAEAFTVLSYLLDDAALDLATIYGGYPARSEFAEPYIKSVSERYPSVENWSIVVPSLEYAAVPHHESWYPNYAKGQQRFNDFRTLLYGDTGGDMDLNAELDKLQADLQAIVDAAP